MRVSNEGLWPPKMNGLGGEKLPEPDGKLCRKAMLTHSHSTCLTFVKVTSQSHQMLLPNTTALEFQESYVHIPHLLWNLLNALNLSVALWMDNSTFSLDVTNNLIFTAPILHFNSNVDLRNSTNTVICLVLGKPSSIDSAPYFHPVPKRSVLLLTDSFDSDTFKEEPVTWTALHRYQHTQFIWLNLYPTNFKIFTLSLQENGKLVEIGSEEALNIFQDVKPLKIPNFQGREILVMVTNFSVYSYVVPGNDQSNFTDGVQNLIFDEACGLMNLKPKYLMGSNYGNFENGTFTKGIQRDVMEMKYDAFVGGVYFKPGAIGLIEMSEPWGFICVRYLVPRPKALNSVRYVMMNVFSLTTWLTTMGTVLGVTGISTVIARNSQNAAFKNYCNIINSFFVVIFQLIQIRHPSRSEYVGCFFPLLLSWGWFGFLLTSAYNSELAASFTKPRFSNKIQTEAEFIQNGYTWGTQEADQWWLLLDMDNPYTFTWVNEHFELEKEGDRERKLRQGEKYILLGFTYGKIFYYHDQNKPPDNLTYSYEVSDNCVKEMYTGILFPPGSPYLKGFNLIKSRLLAAGILQKKEYDKMLTRPLLKNQIPKGVFTLSRDLRVTASYVQLSLSTFYEVFYILLLGYSLSAAVFIRELAMKRNKKPRNRGRGNMGSTLESELPKPKAYQRRYYVFRLNPVSK